MLEPLLLLEDLKVRPLSSSFAIVVVLFREGPLRLQTNDRLWCSHCRHRQLGRARTNVRQPERAEQGLATVELLLASELVGERSATLLG